MTSPTHSFRVIPVAKACSSFPVGFSLLNHADRQFVAFYDEEHRITVGARYLDSDAWVFAKPEGAWLPQGLAYRIPPEGSRIFPKPDGHWLPGRKRKAEVIAFDSHNYLTLAVDSMDQLHLSGNMHGDPLIYFRTTKPLDITSFVFLGRMVGDKEDSVTYPLFFRGPKGQFLFRYRDGGSGNGGDFYNIYDAQTSTWKRLISQSVLDGEGKRNAYAELPVLGPDNRWHMIWMWRDTWDCETNHDLSYARSADLIHWETSDGTPLSLPITLTTGESVDPSPINGGLINMSQRLAFDNHHRPIITYHRYDSAGRSQAYAARREKGGWQIRQLSQWNFRWGFHGAGSVIAEVTISAVTRTKEGQLAVSYQSKEAGKGVWILDEETLQVTESRPAFPPLLPGEINTPHQGLHPDMEVQTALPEKDFSTGPVRHVLRWETLPRNRDQAIANEPPPTLLEVIELS